jgi:hypothetical protein
VATVPGGDDADERGPSGSERGREGRGTDRQDQSVSGRGRHGSCVLRGARMSRPGKQKVSQTQMNSSISDLLKSVLNRFKLI